MLVRNSHIVHSDYYARYSIVRNLTHGSTSTVHVAEDVETGKVVLVKRISKKGRSPDLLKAEVRAQTAVSNHPGIVRILDVVEKKNEVDLILEYCSGGELFDHITPDVGMCEKNSVRVLLQAAGAIKHMHDLGFVHRDVKPENLCLTRNGDMKLIDFGASIHMSDNKKPSPYAGTLPYISPECFSFIRTQPTNGFDYKAVDVWAFGTLCFVVFTGKFPWSEATEKSEEFQMFASWCETNVFHTTMTNPINEQWDRFPRDMRELFVNTLRVDPKRRWKMETVCEHLTKMHTVRGI